MFFFFKQKTAYEMRISDWSSDVCSSDLWRACVLSDWTCCSKSSSSRSSAANASSDELCEMIIVALDHDSSRASCSGAVATRARCEDRKSVVEGKSVSVRVDLGGRRIIKKKNLCNS